MKNINVKNSPVTLLEALIVLTIIALVAGVVGFNIRGAMQKGRFDADVDRVVQTLSLAQDLMLIADGDATVFLRPAGKGYYLSLTIDAPVGSAMGGVMQEKKMLDSIQSVEWEGQSGSSAIVFKSGGSVMSRGKLLLKKEELSKAICLPGYPAPIATSSMHTSCDEKALFLELTEQTMEEISSAKK